jgi:hypothetical protein
MNVGSNHSIAWNKFILAYSWHFHLNGRIDETDSPGIEWIFGHQVLRHAAEHGIRSIGTICWQNNASLS